MPNHQIVGAAEVAGEQHRAAVVLDHDARRAEDVPGRREARRRAAAERHGLAELDAADLLQRLARIVLGVERQRGLVLRFPVPVEICRLLLLQVARIREQDRGEVACGLGAPEPAAESAPREPREVAAVVDVRVRKQHCVDPPRVDRGRRPIAQPQLLVALEQPAVDEQRAPARLDEILRAGHRAGRAEKRDPHRSVPPRRSQGQARERPAK